MVEQTRERLIRTRNGEVEQRTVEQNKKRWSRTEIVWNRTVYCGVEQKPRSRTENDDLEQIL